MGDYNDALMRNKDAAVQARTKAQNRANVLQLKLIGQSHPTGLTTNLLKLFEPRPPLEFKPPPEKRRPLPYTGMAQFVSHFAEPGDPEYEPPVKKAETPAERRARIQKIRLEKGAVKAAEELQKYDPHKDPNATGDPYKTLFVARLNYETTEHRIKREFEAYGPIKRVRLITDIETDKPRGYAFIEYMHTRDMKTAYKQADGRKLDNRRVLVDVERGRTVPNWRPRRLGGGLGSSRIGGEDLNQKNSGREVQQIAPGGHRRSEEPRAREERHVDREKSRERGREREREREVSRDRDPREDRHHHRDRERTRDKERDRDREKDRGGRDRDSRRGRDRDRDRGRDRPRDRDRDRGRASHERDHVHVHERGGDYDQVEPMQVDRERSRTRDRDLEPGEHEGGREYYDEKPVKYEHYDQLEAEHERHRAKHEPEYYDDDKGHDGHRAKHELEYYDDKYGKAESGYGGGAYGRDDPDQREEGEAVAEHDYGYQRSERSRSREYEH